MKNRSLHVALAVLAAAWVLGIAGTAGAGPLPILDSADFDWKYEFNVDGELPTVTDLDGDGNGDFRWVVRAPDPTAVVSGGVLKITATDTTSTIGYFMADNADGATHIWPGRYTFAGGYTIEASVKIISSSDRNRVFGIGASPAGTLDHATMCVDDDGQSWTLNTPPTALGGSDSNADAFHVFRVVQDPGSSTYRVWRDGLLLSDSLPSGFTYVDDLDRIYFGDISGVLAGEMEIDYFRFIGGAYEPPSSGEPIPGDANLDDVVNDADASILAAHWQQSGMGWGDGDFNGDEVVNDADASILAAHWQESQEGAAAVPEPGCLVLLLGGLVSLLFVWRRRSR